MSMPKSWRWQRECERTGRTTTAGAGGRRGGKRGVGSRARRLSVEPLEDRRLLAAITLSDADQLMLELINRARANPVAEAIRYGLTDLNQGLPPGTISTAAQPPLAPQQLLVDTAEAHTQWMLVNDAFTHDGPTPGASFATRLSDAGYRYTWAGENIGWIGTTGDLPPIAAEVSTLHENLFQSPGHRKNILNPAATELGPGVQAGDFTYQGTTYHATMTTEDFGRRIGNNFLTGVSFADLNGDQFYSIGEGLQGVVITARDTSSGATYTAATGPSGGYSLQVPPGTYDVQAAGLALESPLRRASVAIALANVKVDFVASRVSTVVASGDSGMCVKDQTAPLHVLANDNVSLGLDPLSLEIVSVPRHGQAQVERTSGIVTYLPAVNFVGLDSFTYQVADLQGHVSAPTKVLIAVLDLTGHAWQNPETPEDVSGDGAVTALDALLLITELNERGAGLLATPSPGTTFPLPYLDVSGTGDLTATDVLMVIGYIDAGDLGIPAQGEASAEATGSPETSRNARLPMFVDAPPMAFDPTGPAHVCSSFRTDMMVVELLPAQSNPPNLANGSTAVRKAAVQPRRAMPGCQGPASLWTPVPDSLESSGAGELGPGE